MAVPNELSSALSSTIVDGREDPRPDRPGRPEEVQTPRASGCQQVSTRSRRGVDPRWTLRISYSIVRSSWTLIEDRLADALGEGAQQLTTVRRLMLAIDELESRWLADPAGTVRAADLRRTVRADVRRRAELRAQVRGEMHRRAQLQADRLAWERALARRRAQIRAARGPAHDRRTEAGEQSACVVIELFRLDSERTVARAGSRGESGRP